MSLIEELDKPPMTDKIAEPPKRWRNWFRVDSDNVINIETGEPIPRGTIDTDNLVHPTKEIAEEDAPKSIALARRYGVEATYLGAEPDDE